MNSIAYVGHENLEINKQKCKFFARKMYNSHSEKCL